jgi:hypothetical protein
MTIRVVNRSASEASEFNFSNPSSLPDCQGTVCHQQAEHEP